LNHILDEFEPAHAERSGQHGDKPAELVAKKVLHQRSRFSHTALAHAGSLLRERA